MTEHRPVPGGLEERLVAAGLIPAYDELTPAEQLAEDVAADLLAGNPVVVGPFLIELGPPDER